MTGSRGGDAAKKSEVRAGSDDARWAPRCDGDAGGGRDRDAPAQGVARRVGRGAERGRLLDEQRRTDDGVHDRPRRRSRRRRATPSSLGPVREEHRQLSPTLLPNKRSVGPRCRPAGWTTDGRDGQRARRHRSGAVRRQRRDLRLLGGQEQRLDLAGGLSVATASGWLGNGDHGRRLAFYAYDPGDAAKSLAQVRQNATSTCDGFTDDVARGQRGRRRSPRPRSAVSATKLCWW